MESSEFEHGGLGALMGLAYLSLKQVTLKSEADYVAPDGSQIRLLPEMKGAAFAIVRFPPARLPCLNHIAVSRKSGTSWTAMAKSGARTLTLNRASE